MVERRHGTLDLKVGFKNCYPTRIFSLSCEWCWRKLRSASFFTSLFFILEEHPCMMAKWHFPVIYNYLMSSLFRWQMRFQVCAIPFICNLWHFFHTGGGYDSNSAWYLFRISMIHRFMTSHPGAKLLPCFGAKHQDGHPMLFGFFVILTHKKIIQNLLCLVMKLAWKAGYIPSQHSRHSRYIIPLACG